jgi:FMN phosphatase YigB (HAD superfamily)
MLLQACAHYGICPQQLAYVGDNPETDGLAAVNAGCIGILINPDWRNYAQPDKRLFGFNSLTEFSTWLQANRVLN